jgi:DNA polymerase
MVESAAELIPERPTLASVRRAARTCTACDLYRNATQTVFGAGPARARVMLVGEQPGDQEDRAGDPFVGPAGQLLDRCLEEAGIDRSRAYVTNTVKHFKWEARGKRRIHKKPNLSEVTACRPWLDTELRLVQPEALVLLGATAAQQFRNAADARQEVGHLRRRPANLHAIDVRDALTIGEEEQRAAVSAPLWADVLGVLEAGRLTHVPGRNVHHRDAKIARDNRVEVRRKPVCGKRELLPAG